MQVPDVVCARLEQLSLDTFALQAPNFVPEDLIYHEPEHPVHDPATGVWALEGGEYSFSLVGQVSAHHTFLGEYGDLRTSSQGGSTFSFTSLLRAKWKIALVLPSASGASLAVNTLHRQAKLLRQIEANCYAASPLKVGTVRGTSFVHHTEHGDRVSVYSANIYRLGLDPEEGDVPGSAWSDSKHYFRNAVDERKTTTVVRPLDLHAADGTRVPMEQASAVFTPGSWIEVYCVLKMWDTSDVPVRGGRHTPRRPPVRSFQIVFDAAQHLCPGRLSEPPRTDAPVARIIKRTFTAVSSSTTSARPPKLIRLPDAPSAISGSSQGVE